MKRRYNCGFIFYQNKLYLFFPSFDRKRTKLQHHRVGENVDKPWYSLNFDIVNLGGQLFPCHCYDPVSMLCIRHQFLLEIGRHRVWFTEGGNHFWGTFSVKLKVLSIQSPGHYRHSLESRGEGELLDHPVLQVFLWYKKQKRSLQNITGTVHVSNL